MSRTALWIAIALAAVLAVVAFWVTTSDGPLFDDDAPLLGIDPSRVVALRIAEPGRGEVVAMRHAHDDWSLLSDAPGAPGSTPWPVHPARVRTTLRILADARPLDDDAPSDALRGDVTTVRFDLDDGTNTTLRIGATRLGGRAQAQVDDRPVVALDVAVVDGLNAASVLAWRDTGVVPFPPMDASRVRLTRDGRTLALGKVEGAWSLREPHPARVNQAAVRTLLDALSQLSVARFIDTPEPMDPETSGLGAPRWTIELERDVREIDESGGVRVRTRRATLAIGAPADMEGTGAFASTGDDAARFVMRTEPLREISLDPLAFVDRTATGVLPANVGMIVLAFADGREVGYRRGLDGWRALTPQGFAPVDELEEDIEQFLTFLSARIAPEVRLGPPSPAAENDGFTPVATVQLLGFTEEPLDALSIGALSDDASTPAVRSADAVRIYPGATLPALLSAR